MQSAFIVSSYATGEGGRFILGCIFRFSSLLVIGSMRDERALMVAIVGNLIREGRNSAALCCADVKSFLAGRPKIAEQCNLAVVYARPLLETRGMQQWMEIAEPAERNLLSIVVSSSALFFITVSPSIGNLRWWSEDFRTVPCCVMCVSCAQSWTHCMSVLPGELLLV